MNNKALIIGIVVVILILVGIAVYQKSSAPTLAPVDDMNAADQTSMTDASTTPQMNVSTTTATTTAAASTTSDLTSAKAAREITITGKSYSFTPAALSVTKGDKVKI